MTRNTYGHGHFVWHELTTPDGAGAEAFYTALLGWTFQHSNMGEMGIYRVFQAGDRQQGGIVQMADEHRPSAWCGYVSVPDVDAAAKTAETKGGKVVFGPFDIPNVGRFATILDPEGAAFVAFRDNKGDMVPEGRPSAGDFCWDSLNVKDGEAALAFYGDVVGWKRGGFGDAPGLFFTANDGKTVADVDPLPEGVRAYWTAHVVVPDLTITRAKAESLGAKILVPQIDVPNVGKMAIIADPWGAVLSLFEPAPAGDGTP